MAQYKKPVRTSGRLISYLKAKRKRLKDELDRVYYTLPLEEVRPILMDLKDTVDSLSELEDEQASVIVRRRAAA